MTDVNAKYFEIMRKLNDRGELHRNSNVLIVDALNTFLRSFVVNPSLNEDGNHVGGVVGFLKSVGAAIKKFSPTRVIIVFDGTGGSKRRKEIYPDYKEQRKNKLRVNRSYDLHTDEDERMSMKRQVIELAQLLSYLPVTVVVLDYIEADDVIAYMTTDVLEEDVTIMSSDKDFLQLVNDRVQVYAPTKKTIYTKEEVYREYGVTPTNYLMLRIFSGDASDNIKGVKGVGAKTLLKHFPVLSEQKDTTIDEILTLAEDAGSSLKIFNKIVESKDVLERNHTLMQLQSVNISENNKQKIISAAQREVVKLDKAGLLIKMREVGVLQAFPNIHNWIQDTFFRLNTYREESQ